MAWQRHKVIVMQDRPEWGCVNIVAWVMKRHCGCEGHEGMRMDVREPTFGVVPCEQHGAQAERALDTLKHMPPQDAPVGDLFAQQLDWEINEQR